MSEFRAFARMRCSRRYTALIIMSYRFGRESGRRAPFRIGVRPMTKCPKCSKLAEPQERYCSFCHTVFTSDPKAAASLRLKSGTAKGWKKPSLVVVFILGAAFVQIDAHDSSLEAGSYQAAARDMKRAINDWVAETTGFAAP
jgi:hypothetical protein